MKPLLLAAITLFLSCKKEAVNEAIHQQVVSNSVSHDHSTTSYPVDVETYSECSGEYVHVTGDVTLMYRAVQKEDGAYHITAKDRMNLRGIGVTTGDRYMFHGNSSKSHHYELKGGIYKINYRSVLMSPGSGNKLVFSGTTTFITNAKGELVVSKTEDNISCK